MSTIDLDALLRVAAIEYGTTVDDIIGRNRCAHRAAAARRAVAEILRDAGWTYKAIGVALGGRDHSTVMYYLGLLKTTSEKSVAA